MSKIIDFLSGKKSHIVAILVAMRGLAESMGYVIPVWVDPVLVAFGISAGRSALKKLEK